MRTLPAPLWLLAGAVCVAAACDGAAPQPERPAPVLPAVGDVSYDAFSVGEGELIVPHHRALSVVDLGTGSVREIPFDAAYDLSFVRAVWPMSGEGWLFTGPLSAPNGPAHGLYSAPFAGGIMEPLEEWRGQAGGVAVHTDGEAGRFYAAHDDTGCDGFVLSAHTFRADRLADPAPAETTSMCAATPSDRRPKRLWVSPSGKYAAVLVGHRDGVSPSKPSWLAFYDLEEAEPLGTVDVGASSSGWADFAEEAGAAAFYYPKLSDGRLLRFGMPGLAESVPLQIDMDSDPMRAMVVAAAPNGDRVHVNDHDGEGTSVIYTVSAGGQVEADVLPGVVARNMALAPQGRFVLREYPAGWFWQGEPRPERLLDRFWTYDPATGEVSEPVEVELPEGAFPRSGFFVQP